MNILVHLYASLKKYLPEKAIGNSCVLEIGDQVTIRELLDQLHIPADAPRFIFLNGIHARGNEVLKDGDRVGAFPPVAGG
jgi:sulfur-carrier protein